MRERTKGRAGRARERETEEKARQTVDSRYLAVGKKTLLGTHLHTYTHYHTAVVDST